MAQPKAQRIETLTTTSTRARQVQAKNAADQRSVVKKADKKADKKVAAKRTSVRKKAAPLQSDAATAVGQKRGRTTMPRAKATGDTASSKRQTSSSKKTPRRRRMEIGDLVPGPLPVRTDAPQQTGYPRKIRL